jgi:hypothetical protein
MRRLIAVLALVPVCVGLGCGDLKPQSEAPKSQSPTQSVKEVRQDGEPAGGEVAGKHVAAEAKQDPAEGKQPQPRKIIYTGDVSLVVDDFEEAEARLRQLVKEYRGYVAKSEVQGVRNRRRNGKWTVRIPVASGEEFREGLGKLGELSRSSLDSQDISDQYYDTQAVLLNLEAEEKTLRGLYDQKIAGTKVADLLEVRRELARVRGEINTLKGRLQRWDKEVAFTTFTVTLIDRRDYVPPTPVTFGSSVGQTFSGSVDALVRVGKFLVLAAVALAPWVPVLLVLGYGFWWGVRRLNRATTPPPRRVVVAELAGESPPVPGGVEDR